MDNKSEILQVQTLSEITDYGEEDKIGYDVSCNLGSINITRVMESKNIEDSVKTAMDMLTSVSKMTSIKNAPGVRKANDEIHSVGLGVLDLNGFLAKNKIMYESDEAKDFANTFFMMMNFYSLKRSMEISRETGETFKGFELSDYADGLYFQKYINNDYAPIMDKVKSLFEGIHIPTKEDWVHLSFNVMKYGIYHGYRLTIPPTASISYLANTTPAVMPINDKIERRMYGDSITHFPAPYLSKETNWYYKSAYDIDTYKLLDLMAIIQEHIDQGISTTLFVNEGESTKEIAKKFIYAHKIGLKTLYYARVRNNTVETCISCDA